MFLADHAKPAASEIVEHLLVVHELAVDGDRFGPGHVIDDREGVANAEAHAQNVGLDDFHDYPLLRLAPAWQREV